MVDRLPSPVRRAVVAVAVALAWLGLAIPGATHAGTDTGRLQVRAGVAGARVSLDGRHLGAAPLNRVVTVGRYTLRVERDGYAAVQDVVDVRPGETTEVVVSLRPLPAPARVRGLVGVALGIDARASRFSLWLGVREPGGRVDLAAIFESGEHTTLGLDLRFYVLRGPVRPFVHARAGRVKPSVGPALLMDEVGTGLGVGHPRLPHITYFVEISRQRPWGAVPISIGMTGAI
jgi:hypothetical protein